MTGAARLAQDGAAVPVDALVNNAGIFSAADFRDLTEAGARLVRTTLNDTVAAR